MITSPNTGVEIILPGRQDIILFSGAPNLIVTLFPPLKPTLNLHPASSASLIAEVIAAIGKEEEIMSTALHWAE